MAEAEAGVASLAYEGPEVTLWQAAYFYAYLIARDLPAMRCATAIPPRSPRSTAPAQSVTILARLLGRAVSGPESADTELIASPELLAPLDMMAVLPGMTGPMAVIAFAHPAGPRPQPHEPGRLACDELMAWLIQQTEFEPGSEDQQSGLDLWEQYMQPAHVALRNAAMATAAVLGASTAPLSGLHTAARWSLSQPQSAWTAAGLR